MSLRIVGIIGKPHGVKGEITVRLVTDYPKSFKKGDNLYIQNGKKKVTVENIKAKTQKGKTVVIIKFTEFDNDTNLDEFRNDYIWRSEEDAPKLREGQYWLDNLPGYKVYEGNNYIGLVEQALDFPANQAIVVAIENELIKDNLGSSIVVPFVETYISQVDARNKIIILKQIPEYI